MNISSKQRNIIIGTIIAVALIGGAAYLAASGGSGGSSSATTATVSTAGRTTPTRAQTSTTAAAVPTTAEETPVIAEQPAAATPAPAAAVSLEIVSESESPGIVKLGDPVTFTIKVKGTAASVSVIYGAAGGDISTPHYSTNLLPQGTVGDITTWTSTVSAPKGSTANGGQCFFHAVAVTSDGQEVKSPGQVDTYQTFVVT